MNKKRKKSSSKQKQNTFFSRKNIVIFILVFTVPILVLYSLHYFEAVQNVQVKHDDEKTTIALMNKMKKMLEYEKQRLQKADQEQKTHSFQKLPPAVVEGKQTLKEEDSHLSEISDYQKSLESATGEKPIEPIQKKYKSSGKPKLAIIIDDVSYAHQVKLIKEIPFKVTPSFFPASPNHPDTPALAKKFLFAMVHLPLEAISYSRTEPQTLNANDSLETIESRIQTIKNEFPFIQYYNNHTGSKFTSNIAAMEKLFFVFKKEHLSFVDSRTTAQTKAPQIAQKYKMELFSRDVFLDNDVNPNAIKKQLLQAVSIAKKHGFAIAIGHPHANTLSVLKGAKPLLKDVQIVYLKEL